MLAEQLERVTEQMENLKQQYVEISTTKSALEQKLASIEARPDLDEYEALLTETMSELDDIKRELSEFSASLFSSNGEIQNTIDCSTNPHIQELMNSVRTFIMCAVHKKRTAYQQQTM